MKSYIQKILSRLVFGIFLQVALGAGIAHAEDMFALEVASGGNQMEAPQNGLEVYNSGNYSPILNSGNTTEFALENVNGVNQNTNTFGLESASFGTSGIETNSASYTNVVQTNGVYLAQNTGNGINVNSTIGGLQYGYTVNQVSNGNTNGTNNQTNTNGTQNSQSLQVTTLGVNNVGTAVAELQGSFSGSNGTTVMWFEYGTSTNNLSEKTVADQTTTTVSSFSKTIFGLIGNTTYYYRAVAQTGQTIDYGMIKSFTTDGYFSLLGNSNNDSGNSSSVNSDENNNSEVLGEDETNRNNLGALAFFSGGFFPNTFLGWLLLIILILAVIMLARRYSKKKSGAHGGHH